MRAATSSSASEPLHLVDLPSRPLRPGELRVRVRSIGVNPVDWKMRAGGPLGTAQRLIGPRGPLVVGIDFAGEVSEVTAAVTDLPVGTRVVGGTDFSRHQPGSYADEVIVRPDQCASLPDAVSFDDAACLPVAAVTAWRWLVEVARLGERPDPRVLVLGASGGVGLFAVQIARSLGAAAVGVCSTRNAPLVAKLGATVVDYTAGDPLTAAAAHGPFDLVLNAVGSDAYPRKGCVALLRPTGMLGLVVVHNADLPALVFSPRVRTILGRPTRAQLAPLVDLLARGALPPVIAGRLPLAEAERAHTLSRSGKVVGKLLLVP